MNAIEIIKNFSKNTSSDVNVTDLVSDIYWALYAEGHKSCVVNEKGIELKGMNTIWFRRDNKNNCWKAFMVVDYKNKYL